MPNELTDKQCNLLQERYLGLKAWKSTRDLGPWIAVRSTDREGGTYGSSRQDVLTKWCKIWSPDWTPPVIHDAEWALRYARQHNLCFGRVSVWESGAYERSVNIDDGLTTVDVILKWKARYDPDKPTRKETAVEVLEEVVKADCTGLTALDAALSKASDFLHGKKVEADHVD